MSKYIVYITPIDDGFLWDSDDWKTYVCADFDENVVILGRTINYAKASWWESVEELLEEIPYDDEEAFVYYNNNEYAEDKLHELYDEIYRDWDGENENEFKAKVAMFLYPGLDLTVSTIRGFSQGDWAEVVYVTDSLDENILEDWYFGNVYDVRLYEISDEDVAEIESEGRYDFDDEIQYIISEYGEEVDGVNITYTELRDVERNDGHKENGFIKFFGLPEDSDITVIEEY